MQHSFNVPNVIDYLDVAPSFGIEKLNPPASFVGRTLGELDLKGRLGLTPVALRRGREAFVNPATTERIVEGDELILIGRDEKLSELRRPKGRAGASSDPSDEIPSPMVKRRSSSLQAPARR